MKVSRFEWPEGDFPYPPGKSSSRELSELLDGAVYYHVVVTEVEKAWGFLPEDSDDDRKELRQINFREFMKEVIHLKDGRYCVDWTDPINWATPDDHWMKGCCVNVYDSFEQLIAWNDLVPECLLELLPGAHERAAARKSLCQDL